MYSSTKGHAMTNTKKISIQELTEFCKQTSLHGWHYLTYKNGIGYRIFWMSIVLICNVAAAYLLFQKIDEFMNATTVTNIGKKEAQKMLDWFTLNIGCFWESFWHFVT